MMRNKAKDLRLYATDLANPDNVPWSSNYNMIEVNPDDIPKLMELVFKDKMYLGGGIGENIMHIAPGVPDNHLPNGQRVDYSNDQDYMLAVDALHRGDKIQIFNWDINMRKDEYNDDRFLIGMPDGMPGFIADEVWRLLRSKDIGMIYHI